MRLVDREAPGRHRDQQHRFDVQSVREPDQVLGPIDVHLAFFPTDRPGVLEPQDVREVPLAGIGAAQLPKALHAEPPELLGRGMSECFHWSLAAGRSGTLGNYVTIANPVETQAILPGKIAK